MRFGDGLEQDPFRLVIAQRQSILRLDPEFRRLSLIDKGYADSRDLLEPFFFRRPQKGTAEEQAYMNDLNSWLRRAAIE